MNLAFRIALVGILGWAVQGVAQAPTKLAKAGAEQKKLSYFAGTWKLVADLKSSPFTVPGKFKHTETNAWLPGGFYMVSHTSHSSPAAQPFGTSSTGTAIWGYDPDEKTYTYDAYHSMGIAEHFKGTVSGDTWTWTGIRHANGQTLKLRYTVKELSPSSYTSKLEQAPESGGEWSTVMEGKATKVAAKPSH